MDWDRIMTNTARGTDFTGRTAADEQAYFDAFAGTPETPARRWKVQGFRQAAIAILGFFSIEFMPR